ncbi:MAG TPA: response regulator [Desulfuromonadales bacterium]|jgi:CheY-like chemotaxis protein
MSLVGNLEDLGLGDILQIVSLSRKSGVLSLHGRGREGRITFQDGQVIQAASSIFRENLGDLLLRKGLVEIETLRQALTIQRQGVRPQRIGAILAGHFGLSQPAMDAIVKEQVEKIIYNFFSWTEGTFSFDVGGQDELADTRFSPLQFMLEQGLNPQWLAMEGSRLLDEKRHRGESLEESPDEPVLDTGKLCDDIPVESAAILGEALPKMIDPSRSVLLVDDDDLTRQLLSEALRDRGYTVIDFSLGKDFLAAVETAVGEGRQPALLIDLIMPRLDGSGLLGGYELLEDIRKRFPGLTTVVISDFPNEETERRVRRLDVPVVVSKPKKNDVLGEHGRRALAALGETLAVLLDGGAGLPAAPLYDIGAELLRELGETGVAARGKGPESPGLRLLRGMLQELNNPALGGEISLLVLRFASEMMNRAVIFQVKEQEIVGLGQFGIEFSGEMADARIRRMRIPRNEDSVFAIALNEMAPMKLGPGSSHWDDYLRKQLGGDLPEQIFLGPIISEGTVVAVLYGDNLPEKKPIGDTEALEIFLSQVGLAMEKALLERRLREKTLSNRGSIISC